MNKQTSIREKRHFSHDDIKMTEGPVFSSLIRFVVPLVIAGILQVLYNAADIIVIGNFGGIVSVSAVGATSSIISLVVNTFMGLAVGSNVILARFLGAKNEERVSKTVHTACLFSLLLGVALAVLGEATAYAFLVKTGCTETALPGALLYLRIYYLGTPAVLFYNFMAAVLRTKGDSRRPLIYLAVSGLLNVTLNLIFVAVLHMDVAGVAIATVSSQVLSALLVLFRLLRLRDSCRLEPRKIRIHGEELKKIVRFGLPSAISSAMYSLTNVQIQSAINSFGDAGISGNATCISVESFLSAAIATFTTAAAAFIGQNLGANKRERVPRILRCLYITSISVALVMGIPMLIFGRQLLSIYIPGEEAAIDFGLVRMQFIISAMVIAAVNQVNSGALQAFGYTIYGMLISIVGVCGLRFLWMAWIYPRYQTPEALYLCYPISWFIVMVAGLVVLIHLLSRYRRGAEFRL